MKNRDQMYEPLYSSLYEDDIRSDRPSVHDKLTPKLSGSDWVRIVLLSLGTLGLGWAVLVLLFGSNLS